MRKKNTPDYWKTHKHDAIEIRNKISQYIETQRPKILREYVENGVTIRVYEKR